MSSEARSVILPSGKLIICERLIQTDAKIVNWHDAPHFSAYHRCCYRGPSGPRTDPHPYHPARGMENRTARYRPRKELLGQRTDLSTLQRLIRQLVIHHDGANSSAECFHILHDERGLSVHFLIDTDGTIYQTLDLADVAFHAQFVNGSSLGIELCNRGIVSLPCDAEHKSHREPRDVTIHGHPYRMWSYTDAQYDSLFRLTVALARVLPELPLRYPSNQGPIYSKLLEPERFSGILGHYHVSAEKWDPGCFDFPRLLGLVTGTGRESRPARATGERADSLPLGLARAEELSPHGGLFPVGQCGKELVWHGGLHVQRRAGEAVPALLQGQVCAARLSRRDGPFGSTNFVLTKHRLSGRFGDAVFFILYYHLEAALVVERAPPFWQRAQARLGALATLPGLEVWFPEVDLLVGEHVGNVGVAGPRGAHVAQLHIEVLAPNEVAERLFPGRFAQKDCGGQAPRCLDPAILASFSSVSPSLHRLPDSQRDSRLLGLRRLAVRFRSEWLLLGEDEFDRGLRSTALYRGATTEARQAVYCEQVLPSVWLDQRVAQRVGLPVDGVVWHYHPVEFLTALDELHREAHRSPDTTAERDDRAAAGPAQDGASGDEGYASEEDRADFVLGAGDELSTEELASGYPSHWLR